MSCTSSPSPIGQSVTGKSIKVWGKIGKVAEYLWVNVKKSKDEGLKKVFKKSLPFLIQRLRQ